MINTQKLRRTAASLALFLSFAPWAVAAETPPAIAGDVLTQGKWELMGEGDGVTSFSKAIPGSDIVAFRGDTIVDAPAGQIATVLMESSQKQEWVYRVAEAYTIKELTPWSRIEYNHTKGYPVILNDRDFVFHAISKFDPAQRRVIYEMKSQEVPEMPVRNNIVRGELNLSRYILTEVEPNKRTRLEVEIFADPKGSVPIWVVNLFQKSWPQRTLNGIRQQIAKGRAPENTIVRDILNGKTKTGFPR